MVGFSHRENLFFNFYTMKKETLSKVAAVILVLLLCASMVLMAKRDIDRSVKTDNMFKLMGEETLSK